MIPSGAGPSDRGGPIHFQLKEISMTNFLDPPAGLAATKTGSTFRQTSGSGFAKTAPTPMHRAMEPTTLSPAAPPNAPLAGIAAPFASSNRREAHHERPCPQTLSRRRDRMAFA